jgi:hypothetical protein
VIQFEGGRSDIMKRIGLLVLVAAATAAFLSCTLGETATLALKNSDDSTYTVTKVTFTPTGAGTTMTKTHTIPPGERHYLYSIEPNTYNVTATFEGYGDVTVENNWVMEGRTVYFRTVEAK